MKKFAVMSLALAAVASSQAVTFSSVTISSPPLSNGSSYSVLGNSISFNLPNAIVGDAMPLRVGTVNIQFDVASGANMWADQIGINIGNAIAGSGQVIFNEAIFELDSLGNEVGGGPIGTYTHIFNSSTGNTLSHLLTFSRTVENLRVKKSFTLVAPDTQSLDLAGVAIVNQNIQVVPEPATMIALGAGALALIRRKRNG